MPSTRNRTRVCPECGVLLDPIDTRCFHCGASLPPPRPTGYSLWVKQNFELQGEVTRGLLLINVFVFLLTWLFSFLKGKSGMLMDVDADVLRSFGAKSTDLILQGQFWRLVTAIFLHANFVHIFFNMWAFIQLGQLAEEIYGWQLYIFFYIFSGGIGYAASVLAYPGVISIGASGAIMGLIGVLLAYSARNWGTHGKLLGKRLLFWVAIILGYGFLLPNIIDNAAHVGGLLSGFIVAFPFSRSPFQKSPFQRNIGGILGWWTVLVILASFLAMGFSH